MTDLRNSVGIDQLRRRDAARAPWWVWVWFWVRAVIVSIFQLSIALLIAYAAVKLARSL